MRKFKAFEISLVLFLIVAFVVIWRTNITISEAQIPTVINGLVASISMIIGFAGAIMVFTLSKRWDNLKLGSPRPMIYLPFIGVPLALLWSMYYYFIVLGNSDIALKMALLDLAIASALLVDFLAYYTRETILQMRENTRKADQSIQVQPKREEKKNE